MLKRLLPWILAVAAFAAHADTTVYVTNSSGTRVPLVTSGTGNKVPTLTGSFTIGHFGCFVDTSGTLQDCTGGGGGPVGPPGPTTLGGVYSFTAPSNQFLTGIATSGTPLAARPSCANLSNAASSCSTDATVASNIASGTLGAARLPALTGDCAASIGTGVLVCTKTNGVAFAASATTNTTNAANISSGTLPAARLPAPSTSTFGGVKAKVPVASEYVTGVGTDGVPTTAQPSCNDLSDAAPSCATDATNASNLSAGTVPAARLPPSAPSALGGVNSKAALANQFLTQIGVDGSVLAAQPSCANLSDAADSCSVDATDADNIISGTISNSLLSAIPLSKLSGQAGGTVVCNATGSSASPTACATIPASTLPNPSSSTLGGVQSKTVVSNQFLTGISTSGVPSAAQPACASLSDASASCSTDATNASNLASGTVPAARLPTPAATTLGGIKSKAAVSHQFLNSVGTDGAATAAQPVCADLSDASASCATDATNAANIASGTLPAARLPTPTSSTLGGIKSKATVSNQFLTGLDTAGALSSARPACADLSDASATCSQTGLLAPVVSTRTSNYAPSVSQSEVVLCNATLTVTLPTAVGNTHTYTVKLISASGVVTLATTGGQTIDGSSSLTIYVQTTSVDLISDGANWLII